MAGSYHRNFLVKNTTFLKKGLALAVQPKK